MSNVRVLVEVIASLKRQLRALGVDPARVPQGRTAAERCAHLSLALDLVEDGMPPDEAVATVARAIRRLL